MYEVQIETYIHAPSCQEQCPIKEAKDRIRQAHLQPKSLDFSTHIQPKLHAAKRLLNGLRLPKSGIYSSWIAKYVEKSQELVTFRTCDGAVFDVTCPSCQIPKDEPHLRGWAVIGQIALPDVDPVIARFSMPKPDGCGF